MRLPLWVEGYTLLFGVFMAGLNVGVVTMFPDMEILGFLFWTGCSIWLGFSLGIAHVLQTNDKKRKNGK